MSTLFVSEAKLAHVAKSRVSYKWFFSFSQFLKGYRHYGFGSFSSDHVKNFKLYVLTIEP